MAKEKRKGNKSTYAIGQKRTVAVRPRKPRRGRR